MVEDPITPTEKPYDPYAPEVVRKMAVVALLCAFAAFAVAAFFGVGGFLGYEEYVDKIRNGEPIYAPWLYAWLLRNFGPVGVLVFDGLAAVVFLGLSAFGARQWWTMRTGRYNPEEDAEEAPSFLLTFAIVAVIGLLTFFTLVRIVEAFR